MHRLARALASVINIVDPDVIVLGGGLSNIDTLYDRVPGLWQNWVFSDHSDTPLLKNHHGDSSDVRGAAWLWPSKSLTNNSAFPGVQAFADGGRGRSHQNPDG